MGLEHPVITQINKMGYPYGYENDYKGTDSLGNEIYEGDRVLVLNDEYFVEEELFEETKEVLEMLGAEYQTA